MHGVAKLICKTSPTAPCHLWLVLGLCITLKGRWIRPLSTLYRVSRSLLTMPNFQSCCRKRETCDSLLHTHKGWAKMTLRLSRAVGHSRSG